MRKREYFIGDEFSTPLGTKFIKLAKGVWSRKWCESGVDAVEIKLLGKNDLGRKNGKYYTFSITNFSRKTKDALIEQIKQSIIDLLPKKFKKVLILGMGNNEIISDSLGAKTVEQIDVLRVSHNNKEVVKFCPGVFMVSGIESFTAVQGLLSVFNPDVVIVIDSLCTKEISRLGQSFQVSDAGIVPGSAMGKTSGEISNKTIGVKVISIGVPLVIYIESLMKELIQKIRPLSADEVERYYQSLNNLDAIFSPKDIDFLVGFGSDVISQAIVDSLK